ncbi:MAG: stage III sporulation protein AA [Anaerovoracaceae bacterium]
MEQLDKVIQCFPTSTQGQIANLNKSVRDSIEEIRIYRGKNIHLLSNGSDIILKGIVDGAVINNILNNLMKYSYHSYEEDLAKGFITIDGGHRVGVCGKAVINKGEVSLVRDISSLNIRYSKEVIGCSDHLMSIIMEKGKLNNTLIVSPPNCGKTTLIRDIARNLALIGYKVGICDERSEIAGMYNGIPSYNLGDKVDVLDGCPKEKGVYMLIRSMSPQVIITDEIGNKEDVIAINACVNSGVNVITTLHGNDIDDLKNSQVYETIERKQFGLIVFLSNVPKVGSIREVLHG